MIDRETLEKHLADLHSEFERAEPALEHLRQERKRILRARDNIAGAIKLAEELLKELSRETTSETPDA